mgnify:FL=1
MNLIKRMRWQILIIIAALVIIAVVLWGQQAEPVLVEAPEPTGGGVYREGILGEFMRINPLLAEFNPPDQDVTRLLFNGLIQFDPTGLPQPDLSNAWNISRDGTVYNFSLRDDVFWHDGEQFNSDDVVFTLNLLKNPDFPVQDDLREFWNEIEYEKLDDYTILFRLPEPFAPFLDYLTFGILPEHLLGEMSAGEIIDDPFNLLPVGTGMFRFEELLTEDGEVIGVALGKNTDYFADEAFFDRIEFYYFDSEENIWESYQAGEIDGIAGISKDLLPEVLMEPELNLYTSRLPEMTIVFLNLDNPETPFFQNVEIRKALLHGVNRQCIVDRINAGQAIIAEGPVFPKTWAYNDALPPHDFDPELAEEIIRDLGYTYPAEGGNIRENEDGVKLQFTLTHPDDPIHTEIAQSIQGNWSGLGIDVELEALSYEELIQNRLEPRTYEAVLLDLNLTGSPDPDPYPFWHQAEITGGQNYAMWNDRRASESLEQARIVKDILERQRLYRNFQVRFHDQLPALPLYYPVYNYAVSTDVKGVRIGPVFEPADRLETIGEWYFFFEVPGGQDGLTDDNLESGEDQTPENQ